MLEENVQDPQGRNLDGKAHQSSVDPSIGAHQGTPLRNTGLNEEIMQAFREEKQVTSDEEPEDFGFLNSRLRARKQQSNVFRILKKKISSVEFYLVKLSRKCYGRKKTFTDLLGYQKLIPVHPFLGSYWKTCANEEISQEKG